VSREQQRRRIEQALTTLPWSERWHLGLDTGGQAGWATLAGLLLDAFAPELASGRDATEAVARISAAMKGRRLDDTVPVRAVLDALYGEEHP